MVGEFKYCISVIKRHFNKELVVIKEDKDNFKSSTKYWICNNFVVEDDVKVRDHCHVTEKYRGTAHRDCDIKVKSNYKISIMFHNLKNCDV